MKHFHLALLLTGVLSLHVFGQKNVGIRFDTDTHEFGEVNNWNNPPAVFSFKNTGKSNLLFLPAFPKNDIYVDLPKGSIEPGESGEVSIFFFTSQLGEFKKSTSVYVNISDKPIELVVKGNIISLSPAAYIECPGFAPKQEKNLVIDQEIRVIDSKTLRPVAEVPILLSNEYDSQEVITNEKGLATPPVQIGLYTILVEKLGFIAKKEQVYLNRQTGPIIIKIEQEPIQATVSEPDMPAQTTFEEPVQTEVAEIIEQRESFTEPAVIEDVQNSDAPVIVEESERYLEPFQHPVELQETLLPVTQFNPNNIVFLIDISTSMKKPDKLPLLKTAMKQLASVLRDIDRVTVITYSSKATIAIPTTSVDQTNEIATLIDSIKPGGWTHGVKGIQTAYEIAQNNFISGGNNQIILATDGLFNHPNFSEHDLFSFVKSNAQNNIILSVIGFGQDRDAERMMKKLAFKGEGNFIKITDHLAARNILVEEIKLHSWKTN